MKIKIIIFKISILLMKERNLKKNTISNIMLIYINSNFKEIKRYERACGFCRIDNNIFLEIL